MMASYAVQTGQIIGCKPNTLAWWHEQRHKQQFEQMFPMLKKIYTYDMFLLLFAIIFFSGLWQIAAFPTALGFLLEADAWVWSLWKMKKLSVA